MIINDESIELVKQLISTKEGWKTLAEKIKSEPDPEATKASIKIILSQIGQKKVIKIESLDAVVTDLLHQQLDAYLDKA